MKKTLKYSFLLICIVIVFSCKKDAPIAYDIAPFINFISVNPIKIIEYKDSVVFTISYTDGDADLGENNPDVTNFFLTDNRINITYAFRIPQLAPDNANIAIKGLLSVVLTNTGITDGSTQQTGTFSIYVTDRAGHKSNTVTSGTVTITK